MNVEGMPPNEIFPTPLAFKWSLFSVDSLMVNEAVIPVVRFPTQVTLVAFLSTVYSLVVQKRPLPGEGFATLLAPERFSIGGDLWRQAGQVFTFMVFVLFF